MGRATRREEPPHTQPTHLTHTEQVVYEAGSPRFGAEPPPSLGWDISSTPQLPDSKWINRVLLGALAVAGLALIILSTQGFSLRWYLGWSAFLELLAGMCLIVFAILPVRAGRVDSVVTGAAAACVVSWMLTEMSDLVPYWLFLVSVAVALLCVVLTISTMVRDPQPSDSTGPATASALLLVIGVMAASCLLATVISGYPQAQTILGQMAVAGIAGWGLWVVRARRTNMVTALVLALLGAAIVGRWTDGVTGEITALCLLAAGVCAISRPMKAATPWAKIGAGLPNQTPQLGTAPGAGSLAIAWADLRAWVRTGWPAMIAAGSLYWLTLVVALLATLAIVLAPLVMLTQAGTYDSDMGGTAAILSFLWLFFGAEIVAGAVGGALGLVSTQALTGAVVEHDGTGRVGGGHLVGRALTIFGTQLTTVALYTVAVLLGSLMCAIPGIYLQVRWAFALPAGAAAGVRGSAALGASWRLTENRFWQTFLVQMVGGLLTLASMGVAGLASAIAMALFGSQLIAGFAVVVPVAIGVTCTAVIMGSLYRQYVAPAAQPASETAQEPQTWA